MYKRQKEMGAEHVLDPHDEGIVRQIKDLTDGKRVDCALDLSLIHISEPTRPY